MSWAGKINREVWAENPGKQESKRLENSSSASENGQRRCKVVV